MNRTWGLSAAAIAAMLALPLLIILLQLFGGHSDTWDHLRRTVLSDYILNTFLLVLGVGGLSLLLGISTAWLVSTCEFRGRALLEWGLVLPLAIPSYIAAFAYAGLLDYTGIVQRMTRNLLGWHSSALIPFEIMSLGGVSVVLALVLYPYIYLIARASFRQQSRSLLEASWTLGKGPWQTFVKVALPAIRPALIGGLSLVIMEVLNDYGAVKYYGVSTFTTGIFRAWFSLGDLMAAVRLAAMLLVIVLVLLMLEKMSRQSQRYNGPDRSRPLLRQGLKGWNQLAAASWCWLVFALGFAIPLMQLLSWTWTGFRKLDSLTFRYSCLNTFSVAFLVALLTISIALLIAFVNHLRRSAWLESLSRLATVGYAVPGAVIAIGVMVSFRYGRSLGIDWLKAGTLLALVYACTIRFMAVAYNSVDAGLSKIGRQMVDASSLLGASASRSLRRIVLPLLRGSLMAAAMLVFVDVLKELPLTLILRPFDFDTLATRTFELASDEELEQSAIYALSIIAISLLPLMLLNKYFDRQRT